MHFRFSLMGAGLLALGLLGCDSQRTTQPAAPAPAASDITLRSYDLPPGHGPKIRPILSNLMKKGDDQPVGRTALSPDGRLIVLAPESIHQGVASFLKDLKESGSEVKPPPSIALSYWLIVAAPGPSPQAEQCGSKGLRCLRGGPDLVKAVEAVDATQGPGAGPTHYTLLEHLSIRSMDSERAELNGAASQIEQRASVAGGKIVADLSVRVMAQQAPGVRTRLQFSPDQTVILGQMAFREPRGGESSPDDNAKGMLLFVTRGKVEE